LFKPLWPALPLLDADVANLPADAMELIAHKTYFHKPKQSTERTKQAKPHKSMTQKPCKSFESLSPVDWRELWPDLHMEGKKIPRSGGFVHGMDYSKDENPATLHLSLNLPI